MWFTCLRGMRCIPVALWVLAAALTPCRVRADAIPEDYRSLQYDLRIENLAEYGDYAFILYPTSNNGFGYVVEDANVPLTHVMMNGRHGLTTRLCVMTREELRRHDPTAPRYPHGDDDQLVMVVQQPPPSAPVAEADISPPPMVFDSDPRLRVSRTFRIAHVTPRELDLRLVEEVTLMRDGTRHVRTGDGAERILPTPAELRTPPRAGCRACAAAHGRPGSMGWAALVGLAVSVGMRRARSAR